VALRSIAVNVGGPPRRWCTLIVDTLAPMAAPQRSTARLAGLARHLTAAGAAAAAADEAPTDDVVADEQALRALCRAILAAIGSSEEEQHIVADHLVEAMLKGHDSHGVQMLSG
jgi:hypothetical protein